MKVMTIAFTLNDGRLIVDTLVDPQANGMQVLSVIRCVLSGLHGLARSVAEQNGISPKGLTRFIADGDPANLTEHLIEQDAHEFVSYFPAPPREVTFTFEESA